MYLFPKTPGRAYLLGFNHIAYSSCDPVLPVACPVFELQSSVRVGSIPAMGCLVVTYLPVTRGFTRYMPVLRWIHEPRHDKINKMSVRPAKAQPGHPPSLIRVFAVRMKKA